MPDWHFTAWQSASGLWIGLAKRERFVSDNPVHEPGDVWFHIAETEEEALRLIKAEVLH